MSSTIALLLALVLIVGCGESPRASKAPKSVMPKELPEPSPAPEGREHQEAQSTAPAAAGVKIVWVSHTSVLARSGLRPGDVVTSWSNERGEGAIAGPFDWEWAVLEEAPRGPIHLRGHRKGEAKIWRVPLGGWRARIAPLAPGSIAAAVARAQESWSEEPASWQANLEQWRRVTALATDDLKPQLRSWLHLQAGLRFGNTGRSVEAMASREQAMRITDPWHRSYAAVTLGMFGDRDQGLGVMNEAIETLSSVPPGLLLGRAYFEKARFLRGVEETAEVESLFHEALRIQEREAPGSLEVARTKAFQASLPIRWGVEGALADGEEARLVLRDLDPLGPDLFAALLHLGHIVFRLEESECAAVYYEAAAEQARARGSRLDEAKVSASLSYIENSRGDLRSAEALMEKAREIFAERDPESIQVGKVTNNLGTLAMDRGDLAKAHRYFQDSLEIKAELMPESETVAITLGNLGNLSRLVGDHERALSYREAALRIFERNAESTEIITRERVNLAGIYKDLGKLDEAAGLLAAARIGNPMSPAAKLSNARITNLEGEIAKKRGQLARAEEHFLGAFDVFRRLDPKGLFLASLRTELAGFAIDQGRFDDAERQLGEAALIVADRAPGTALEARIHYVQATVSRARGDTGQALEDYLEALEALEAQIDRLGADVADRGTYRASFSKYYEDPMTLLLDLGREAEAHEILERFRAASLLAALAEKDIDFSRDVPADLLERKRELEQEIDRLQHKRSLVASQSGSEDADSKATVAARRELEKLGEALDELHLRKRRLLDEVRQASSERYRDLRYPRPLAIAEIGSRLPTGTAMLSYFLGERKSALFVIDSGGVEAFTLEVGSEEIAERVRKLRKAIADYQNPNAESFKAHMHRPARALHDLLIGPASGAIEDADRFVFLPDGALHFMPWGALRTPDSNYLVAEKPFHLALSATFYIQLLETGPLDLRAPHRRAAASRLVAFGDPSYPQRETSGPADSRGSGLSASGLSQPDFSNSDVRFVGSLRNFDFRPLPGSRKEVETIARLFEGETRVFLGERAGEAEAKRESPGADIVHFATHAWWDSRFAMDSALVLSIPETYRAGEENGLLQAWEIFEGLRLDAELVVLSACSTAQGELAGGEGVIGLTRAFQYAGARSVLSSQWDVSDRATTELMASFYRHLRAGTAKDVALQEAQLELLSDPATAAPFFWAAFQLDGDWR